MYIMLTSRCNMTCAHCCFSCTAKGIDISMRHYRKALKLAAENGTGVTLGGGEPTLHPKFTTMLIEAIASEEGGVLVITNGKIVRHAMLIYKLTKAGVIGGKLSRDRWHDEINPRVVKAFESLKAESYFGNGMKYAIHDVTNGGRRDPLPHGRAVDWMEESHGVRPRKKPGDCCCEGVFVTPKGVIRQCGCVRSPVIGHVDTGYSTPANGCCYRSDEYKREMENSNLEPQAEAA